MFGDRCMDENIADTSKSTLSTKLLYDRMKSNQRSGRTLCGQASSMPVADSFRFLVPVQRLDVPSELEEGTLNLDKSESEQ